MISVWLIFDSEAERGNFWKAVVKTLLLSLIKQSTPIQPHTLFYFFKMIIDENGSKAMGNFSANKNSSSSTHLLIYFL